MGKFQEMSGIKIDEIDIKILKLIQDDARITNIELSSKIGLSPGPTLERVKKLEKAQIIEGYHATLNKQKLKFGVSAFIEVNLSRQVDNVMTKFKEKVHHIAEITECYQITGNADYILKVVVKDMVGFEKLINEKLSKIEEIGSMHTSIVISEAKNSRKLPL